MVCVVMTWLALFTVFFEKGWIYLQVRIRLPSRFQIEVLLLGGVGILIVNYSFRVFKCASLLLRLAFFK